MRDEVTKEKIRLRIKEIHERHQAIVRLLDAKDGIVKVVGIVRNSKANVPLYISTTNHSESFKVPDDKKDILLSLIDSWVDEIDDKIESIVLNNEY